MGSRLAGTLMLVSVAGVAQANTQPNGAQMNGAQMNGAQMNGAQMNGAQMNGAQMNGVQLSGQSLSGGLQLSGTMLSGSLIDAPMCAHSETTAGAPLPASCNACAKLVCTGNPRNDPHCCSSAWDATCVAEAQSWCSFTGNDLVGNGALTMSMINADNSTTPVSVRITGIRQPDYWVQKCVGFGINRTCDLYNIPSKGPNKDVNLYSIEYLSTGCTTNCSRSGCQQTCTSLWQPICASTDNDGYSNTAIPVAGAWETRVGRFTSGPAYCPPVGPCQSFTYSWSGGGKIPTGVSGPAFTFACRDVGAVAKCVERNGYKPWLSGVGHDQYGNAVGVSLDDTHQACVRMLRADYCGDGQANTQNGTLIDVADSVGFQSFTPGFSGAFESEWGPGGAFCISNTRYYNAAGLTPPPNWPIGATYSTANYIQDHCSQNSSIGRPSNTCGQASDFNYLTASPTARTMNYSSTLH